MTILKKMYKIISRSSYEYNDEIMFNRLAKKLFGVLIYHGDIVQDKDTLNSFSMEKPHVLPLHKAILVQLYSVISKCSTISTKPFKLPYIH